jgi:hypothetical protein
LSQKWRFGIHHEWAFTIVIVAAPNFERLVWFDSIYRGAEAALAKVGCDSTKS